MIDENNKEILDNLIEVNPIVKKLTYIELGLFLEILGYQTEWASLADAHDYLGGYENKKIDQKIKSLMDIGKFAEVDKMIMDKVNPNLASQKPI